MVIDTTEFYILVLDVTLTLIYGRRHARKQAHLYIYMNYLEKLSVDLDKIWNSA